MKSKVVEILPVTSFVERIIPGKRTVCAARSPHLRCGDNHPDDRGLRAVLSPQNQIPRDGGALRQLFPRPALCLDKGHSRAGARRNVEVSPGFARDLHNPYCP